MLVLVVVLVLVLDVLGFLRRKGIPAVVILFDCTDGETSAFSLLSKADSSKLEKWKGAGMEPAVNFTTSA